MRVVLQRVAQAAVEVDDDTVASIGPGLLLLVGIEPADTLEEVAAAAAKISTLRVFPDERGAMNRSLLDMGGSALVVSQFTLLGSTSKGRRPSFTGAAPPEMAAPLIEELAELLRAQGVDVETGRFGARMQVSLVNDGPVTLVLEFRGGRVV